MSKKTSKTSQSPGRLRNRRRSWLLAMILPLVAIGVFFFFTKPNSERATANEASLQQTQSEAATYKEKLTALQSGQTSSAGVLLNVARTLDAQLPPQISSIELVNQVNAVAATTAVTVTSVTPLPATAGAAGSSTVSSKQFTVTVNGSKSDVISFLDQLQKASPLMTITDLTLTFTVPVAPDPSAAAQAAPSPAATGPDGQSLSGDTTAAFTLNVWFFPDATLPAANAVTTQPGTTTPGQVTPPAGTLPSAAPGTTASLPPAATPGTTSSLPPAPDGTLATPAPTVLPPAPSTPAPGSETIDTGTAPPTPAP